MNKLYLWCACGLLLLSTSCHEKSNHQLHPEVEHQHSDEIILTQEKAQAAGVRSETIQPSTFRQVITACGEVLAAQGDETMVVAQIAGIVSLNTSLTEGAEVVRGAELLTIATDGFVNGNPMQRAKIAYEKAQQDYERASKLIENKIVSAKEFAAIKQNYENAKLDYEALVNQSKGGGRQCVVAPMGGYIKSRLVKDGDYVAVGQPLVSITQNQRLQLRAEVSEKYYPYLNRIQSANFKTPYDDKVYELEKLHSKVLAYGKATETSFFIPITFEFDNRGGVIPGSFVEVYLLSDEIPNSLSLPKSALTEEQGLFYIYLQVDEEGYKKQEVALGADNGSEVQILSGLKAGDRVVTKGAYQIKLASASNAIPAHTHEH